jgi:hypothetical protein
LWAGKSARLDVGLRTVLEKRYLDIEPNRYLIENERRNERWIERGLL